MIPVDAKPHNISVLAGQLVWLDYDTSWNDCVGCDWRNREGEGMSSEGSPTRPVYAKVAHDDSGATKYWFITVDEGWRSSILCDHMYEWAADWLVAQLRDKPYAPGRVP